ncbi:hypothetical protein, partial [Photobacterium phosphoreum]|uniref:hypothetical protein n=1 Tax=Photobacterium phosphoreum TaxID=659 RepID=UPI001B801972
KSDISNLQNCVTFLNGCNKGLQFEYFCSNGLYSRRLSKRVLNTGKPDWKRTISSQDPFPR